MSKQKLTNALTAIIAILVSLPLAEAAFRVAFGIPVFHMEDFRFTQAIRDALPSIAGYDSVLGWHLNPGVHVVGVVDGRSITFSTIDDGIRRNNDDDDGQIHTGGALVAGSSFAAGSEVSDDEAFPAQLETMIGMPVMNGAIGGFGVDQIVLRAEQLLPIVKPKILIVDISSSNITYESYSAAGRPKPYYTTNNDELILHNSPVPTYVASRGGPNFFKRIAGYSYAVNRIMGALFADYWYNEKTNAITRIGNDPAKVACLLFGRLQKEARDAGVTRILLSVQHGGGEIESWDKIPEDLVLVEDCARTLGFDLVDEFDIMKALSKQDPPTFAREYVMEPGHVFGHKSKYGNQQVAARIADELKKPPPAPVSIPLQSAAAAAPIAGNGVNILRDVEKLEKHSNVIARVTPSYMGGDAPSFRVSSIGGNTEHYVAIGAGSFAGGPLTFSLEAHQDDSSQLILQIVDDKGTGVLGYFDLANTVATTQRLGDGRELHADIVHRGDGWWRLSIGVTFPAPTSPSVVIKLVDEDGKTGFQPSAESVLVRKVKLEGGQVATP